MYYSLRTRNLFGLEVDYMELTKGIEAQRLLGEMSYDEMTPEQEKNVVEYETEIWKTRVDELKSTMTKEEIKQQIHDWWLDYQFADGTEDNLLAYADSIIVKQRGYKVIKIYVEDGKLLYDIAVFGENSEVVENVQLCEKVHEKVTTETKTQVEEEYGKELLHNFVNDMLIIQ